MIRGLLFLILLFLLFSYCKKDAVVTDDFSDIPDYQYLFLAHTRLADGDENKLDKRAEKIDYSDYDMLLLGGDLTIETSIDTSTLVYIDSIYSLSNENTLLALGNHDYDNTDLVSHITGRPRYYIYYKNRITFLVLDTQDSLSNIVGNQLDLVRKVTDTISESTHLVVLLHKLIWLYGNPELSEYKNITNGGMGGGFQQVNPNNFWDDIYPMFLKALNRQVEVICIAGDLGEYNKNFEYETEQGIHLLACGLYVDDENDKALILKHNFEKSIITWNFKKVDFLIN
ncbi:MAG: hypothetical protein COC01_08625 [Bacteroidetes bacterium]|nr:MAG: hypothetical protein COC01_08625 [Bacteroidota bacterium]